MRNADGSPPQTDKIAQAHRDILAACQRQGVAPGFHAMNSAEAISLVEQGWKFVAVASDLRFLADGTGEALRKVGLGAGDKMAKY